MQIIILVGIPLLIVAVLAFFAVKLGHRRSEKKLARLSAQAQGSFDKRVQAFREEGVLVSEATEAILFACAVQELSLKNPATAQFAPPEEALCVAEGGIYKVTGYVNTRDDSGALLHKPFTIRVSKLDGLWTTRSDPFAVVGVRLGGHLLSTYLIGGLFAIMLFVLLSFAMKIVMGA